MGHRITKSVESPAPSKNGWWRSWCLRYIRSLQEYRTSVRKPSGAFAELCWTDERGARIITRAVCIDQSEGGVGLLCRTPVPGHVPLEVKLESDGFAKLTRVRHCHPVRDAWLLGAQFVR